MLAALVACSGQSEQQLLESGKAHLDKKDYRAAQIEFKNVIQKNAENAEARFLLGRALLEAGDSVGAMVEFNKIAEGGFDVERLAPYSARAMFNLGDLDKLIAAWADKSFKTPAAQAQVKAIVAMSYGIKGQLDKARAAVDQALAADGSNLEARLAHGQLLAATGDRGGALNDIALAAKAHPDSPRPYLVKARLLEEARAESATITATYQEALKRDARNVQAHIGLIGHLLRNRATDAATAQLEQLRKVEPKGLPTLYFSTLLAFDRKDMKTVNEDVAQMLKLAPDNPAVLQLAGTAEFENANYAQSAAHLGKALNRTNDAAGVRILLARALARAGQPAKAIAALGPLTGENPRQEALTLAGDIYQQSLQDPVKAKQFYQRALSLNPNDRQARSALAVGDIGAGRLDQGLRALQDLARDANGPQIDLLLFGANLKAGRFGDAAAAIEQLERRQPGGALVPYLAGQLALAQGDATKARAEFETAYKRDPSKLGAVSALGALDTQSGQVDAALARYQAFLAKTPQSLEAEMAVVALQSRKGATPAQTRAELERLTKKYPNAAEPAVALARLLIDGKEAKAAQQLARETLANFRENPLAVDLAGQAELAAGDFNQALQTFGRFASLVPTSAVPLMRQAEVYLARQDAGGALTQLRRAVAVEPTNQDAQLQLVALLAKASKPDEALQQALAVQKLLPASPLGWVMEGDLRSGKASYAAAVTAYRTALAKGRVSATAVKLHRAMEDAAQLKEAQVFEAEWRKENPDDPLFNFYLGDRYLVLNKPDIAEGLYRNVLKSQPNDPATLNNLAWILGRKGDAEALKFGEKALAAAPNAPDVMDTVAELHANAGRVQQAVTMQRRAVELAPNSPMLRLRLAQYLVKDNQRAAARKELDALTALGGRFSKQDEVKRLLAAL
jgi:putative PEP-CTERM system TPR-repeat lipoprotein